MKRGYSGIGIFDFRHEVNCGTLFRSALAFDNDFIFTIGRPYKTQSGDTCNSKRHIPCYNYKDCDDFISHLPNGCQPVIIEISDKAHNLKNFAHPERAAYLLGSEGGGIPKKMMEKYQVVSIPTKVCLNLAVAGSVVLYDRLSKQAQ